MTVFYIIIGISFAALAAVFAISQRLVSLVIKRERETLEYCEALEIKRGNWQKGELAALKIETGTLVARDGVNLDYCWHRANLPTNKVCIIVHGFWARRETAFKYAPIYNASGFDVLLFHHRNCGTSGGNTTTMGYLEKKDLADFIALVRQEKGENCIIGLHGESMGGATVLMCACDEGNVDFVVADCPYADLHDQLMFNITSLKHLPPWPFDKPAGLLLKLRGGFTYGDVSPIKDIGTKNGLKDLPILFIHGLEDMLIPYESTLKLYGAKKGKKALYLCPGAGHVMSISRNRAKYAATVKLFLTEYGFVKEQRE